MPKVKMLYWFLMIIATTTGEIVGNYISRDLGLGYKTGTVILSTLFALAICYTVCSKNNSSILYWLLIIIGNIGGTNIADLLCIDLNLGTIYGSVVVAGSLLVLIGAMSIMRKKESALFIIFYWMAIITSSTFGTTSGDFLTNDTPLGAANSSVLLLVILALIAILNKIKKLADSTFYWVAIIIIHPIGATIGNYTSKPIGLNWGNVWTSIFLIAAFILLFRYEQRKSLELNE